MITGRIDQVTIFQVFEGEPPLLATNFALVRAFISSAALSDVKQHES